MSQIDQTIHPKRRTALLLGAAACCCVLLGWLVYHTIFGIYLDGERLQATQRLDAFALSLEATLSRYESLPGLVALDPSLTALLREPGSPQRTEAANAYLEAAQQGAGVAAAFVLDAQGTTLAASNWRLPRSFVGHSYAFRPYFRDAIKSDLGRFYGVGVTTGEPGYFLAAPVRDHGRVRGVVVLKVDLEGLEQTLANAGDILLLTDADGIVFLASARPLRYHSLGQLAQPVIARLLETRQYGTQRIAPLAERPIPFDSKTLLRLTLPGEALREYLVHARPVGGLHWKIVQLGDPGSACATALSAAGAAAFGAAFAMGLAAHLYQRARRREELRRIYAELETRIAERTADLTAQIATLETTKSILRETRDAAVQAGKLTVLGQMSAGISHELNQPLAALQTFSDNAAALLARGRYEEASENLQMIRRLIERTGRIVRQLKAFARKEAATPSPVAVADAIEHALLIVAPRWHELNPRIVVTAHGRPHSVMAEAGRLEQVLVNLLRNGLDAMAGQPEPMLEIITERDGAEVRISVRDHGPGLSDEVRNHLFEPFYTTKPVGEGLGFGLAISLAIAESYGGTLLAHNAAGGGAVFVLSLPATGDTLATTDA